MNMELPKGSYRVPTSFSCLLSYMLEMVISISGWQREYNFLCCLKHVDLSVTFVMALPRGEITTSRFVHTRPYGFDITGESTDTGA